VTEFELKLLDLCMIVFNAFMISSILKKKKEYNGIKDGVF